MANSQENGAERGAPKGKRTYRKEFSLLVNVGDNQAVKAIDIIEAVENVCGIGSLYACVPKSGNMYVITVAEKLMAEYLYDGLKCGDQMYECNPVKKDTMNVSIMNVDAYIEDGEIERKLNGLGVNIIGGVRRICYENKDVENGNRVCKIKLPPNFVSLPYVMKLSDGEHSSMYRVIHDNQRKLCHKCNSADHLFKDCPEFICHRCSAQGHFKKTCTAVWCRDCFMWNCGKNHDDIEVATITTRTEEPPVVTPATKPNDNGIDDEPETSDDDSEHIPLCRGCSNELNYCICECSVCKMLPGTCTCEKTKEIESDGEIRFGDIFAMNLVDVQKPGENKNQNTAHPEDPAATCEPINLSVTKSCEQSSQRDTETMETEASSNKRPHASTDSETDRAKVRIVNGKPKKGKKK